MGIMCLNPSYIKNRKYIPNKKNGGVVPPISDMRVLYVPVGCGVCIECKDNTRGNGGVLMIVHNLLNRNIRVTNARCRSS